MPPLYPKREEKVSPWTPGKFRCQMLTSAPKAVEAKLLPPFGVYPKPHVNDDAPWCLGHTLTGLRIMGFPTEALALQVGEYLRVHCVTPFRNESPTDILTVLPTWVKPWLEEISQSGVFRPPVFPDLPEM